MSIGQDQTRNKPMIIDFDKLKMAIHKRLKAKRDLSRETIEAWNCCKHDIIARFGEKCWKEVSSYKEVK